MASPAPHDPHASFADVEMLTSALGHVFAPWVRELDLRVIEARAGEVTLALPVTPKHVHEGGVLCGQTMMAACDTAMVLAVMTKLGGFKPMTTVQLQTSFLRPVSGGGGAVRVVARVLRMGRSLVFGEMQIISAADELAAHATTTYALL
ncbi:PaaI family thioesterase [Rubrivivax rivuli]|nr:PaaI family thioesterase [Rubrivivax rivuli]